MSKTHTPDAGILPNASIDFDKVQAAAIAGKADIYAGACTHAQDRPAAAEVEESAPSGKAATAGHAE